MCISAYQFLFFLIESIQLLINILQIYQYSIKYYHIIDILIN